MSEKKSSFVNCIFATGDNMDIRKADSGDGIYVNAKDVAFLTTEHYVTNGT